MTATYHCGAHFVLMRWTGIYRSARVCRGGNRCKLVEAPRHTYIYLMSRIYPLSLIAVHIAGLTINNFLSTTNYTIGIP
jgi:hypothetical protein